MLKVSFAGYELADGNRAGASVEEIRDINGQAEVQVEGFLRDSQPTFFDRHIKRNSLRITVRKQVAGAARAYDFALRRRQTLPAIGTLIITAVLDGTTHVWTATRAACQATGSSPMGASVLVSYAIECGTFAYTSTETEPDEHIDGGSVDDMGTEILYRRDTRANILTAIAAEIFADAEPWFETDGGRSGVGNRGANAAQLDLGTIAIIDAGDTTLGLKTWATEHRALITVAAGAAYTRNIVLPNAATGLDASSVPFVAGDTIELRVEVAADPSSDVVLKVYHNAVAGAELIPFTSDAEAARKHIAHFRHDGTQWRLWDTRQINA